MAEEFIANQLANLKIEEHRLDALNNIKQHVTEVAVPQKEPSLSRFLVLLDSLEDRGTSSEQTHLTCDILCMCMSNLEIDSTEWCYFSYLERCLQYKNNDVKFVALKDIERRIKDRLNGNSSTALKDLYRTQTLLDIVACIENGETKIAMLATHILLNLLPTAVNDYRAVKMRLEHILEQKDLIRCRAYELGVKLSQHSAAMHEKYQFILDKLIDDLNTDDVLLQVTTLNFTSEVASIEHGYIYLENQGVFEKVLQQISSLDKNPYKTMLIPGYLKFFGCIAGVQPAKIIRGFPEMIHSLFECLIDGDQATLPVAYDTLGQLAKTSDGKILLDELYSARLKETFDGIGKSIGNLPTPLKIRVLNSLEIVFQCDAQDVQNNRIGSITEEWFYRLAGGNKDLSLVNMLCRNPFPEIKLAALVLLRAICRYPWGQVALNSTAGLIEYLLNRRAEFDKDILHAKHEVLKDLTTSSVFSANIGEQIRKYVEEGAFYIQGVMEVAVEGN